MKDRIKKSYKILSEEGFFVFFLIVTSRFIFLENKIARRILKIPTINRIVWHIYRPLVKNLVIILSYIKPDKYVREDPFKLHWVDPQKIEYKTIPPENFHLGIKWGRKTDEELEKITEPKENINALKKFVNGCSWENSGLKDTDMQQEHINKYNRTNRERKEILESMIESMKEEGYKTQKELYYKNPRETVKQNNDRVFPPLNEINVAMDKEGTLLRRKGHHRLNVAKILGIPKVPVLIQFRHKKLS